MPIGLYTGPNVHTGNGVATVFAYDFKILQSADLKVTVDGVVTTTGFAVSGVGVSGGGSVTFGSAVADGAEIVLSRNRAYSRATDYQRNGSFDEETVDADFDAVVMLIQQLNAKANRAVKAPESVSVDQVFGDADWAARAGKFIRIKNDGSGPEFVAAAPADDSFTQSGVGATARSWSSKVAEIVSVKDFGAKGDSATNDTAAIQAAIDAVAVAGGAAYFPAGTYKTAKLLIAASAVALLGCGGNTTQLSLIANTNDDMIVIGDGATYYTGNRIEKLYLVGNSASQTQGHGIKDYSAEQTHVVSCHIKDFKQDGIHAEGTGTRNEAYLHVLDSYINTNLGNGIKALNQAYSATVNGCVIAGNGKNPAGGAGFYASGNDTHRVTGCLFDENSFGVEFTSASDCVVSGCVFENCDRTAIYGNTVSPRLSITGNVILNPSSAAAATYNGIDIDGTYCTITGNVINGVAIQMSDGIKESAGADYNTITGNTVYNAANPITQAGTHSQIYGNIGSTITTIGKTLSNSLAGDVALNNVANFFTGPQTAQGAIGTWLAVGSVQLMDIAVGGASFLVELTDGTTVKDTRRVDTTAANQYGSCTLSGVFSSPPGNIRIQVRDITAVTGIISANGSTRGKDSTLNVTRLV